VSSQVPQRVAVAVLLVITVASLLFFGFALRLMSLVSTGLAAHREVEAQLRQSLDDQKRLARLDPSSAAEDRRRFDSTADLLRHLRVLEMTRERLVGQVEALIVGAVLLLLACGAALYLFERRSRERRLARIAEGDRRRLRYLEHLSAWQEAARRHAHEIRTPLTAIRMEVDRLSALAEERLPSDEVATVRASILREIGHLAEFTRNFTSFAAIPAPKKRPVELHRLLDDFVTTFAAAWPNLALRLDGAEGHPVVNADAEMLRNVIANLATNSSLALHGRSGTLTLSLAHEPSAWCVYVSDDGPGLPPLIRSRLFEPYTTSRGIGEGMGLGLAISRKILLDHGGDLDLVESTSSGTTFRLTIPAEER
jgi:signal transduction histidine kinase